MRIDGKSDPFYRTTEWLETRRLQLLREPLCRRCLDSTRVTAGTEVDHNKPIADGGHRTDPDNLQTLCHRCHNDKTNQEQGKSVRLGCDADGIPQARKTLTLAKGKRERGA